MANGLRIDPLIGQVIDRYEIEELIGTGAWGNVYRAKNLALDTNVAIKVIHGHVLKDETTMARFRREARLLTCFKSERVIKVIDADVSPVPYIVMEYFDGIPLNQWLRMYGPMKPQMAIDLFSQLCRGLSEAAAFNIVHRDLKPANILIKTYGDIVEAKILDFGLAKCLDTDSSCGVRITSTGEILGSPAYMAPEQFKGECDTRSDIYSLGCIMYEMISGSPAFSAKNTLEYLHKHLSTNPLPISKVNPTLNLPAGLEQLLFSCMEKSVKKRVQTTDLCRMDLEAIKNKRKLKYIHGHRHNKMKISQESIAYSAAVVVLIAAAQLVWHPPVNSTSSAKHNESSTRMAPQISIAPQLRVATDSRLLRTNQLPSEQEEAM